MIFMNWNEFKTWLCTLPKWLRITVIIFIAIIGVLSYITTMQSCSTIRVSQTSTGEVKVTSNQRVLDSTKIEINLLNTKTK